MANLLLIESPGKLKKLSQILGPGWTVKASMGHVRELTNDGEDALGFDLDGNKIHCRYTPRNDRAKKVLSDLRQAVKRADRVYIATDPDREGETIGWHLKEALRLKQPYRVVYSEITPAAVKKAIAQPRTLDTSLVAAGRARDCLDKLVGYKGSRHVVWPLNNGAKSMGRVQSATLHLLCQREREIQAFVPQDYWTVWVEYGEGFKAFYRRSLTKTQSPPLSSPVARGETGTPSPVQRQDRGGANSNQSDDASNASKAPESDRVTTQAEADRLVAIARSHPHTVLKVEGTLKKQSPPPPFITSTLQQAAGQKLKFAPEHTMKVAQALYEAGHITYMRTDSVALAAPFRQAVKQYLSQHDPTNVPQRATSHRSVKGSQDAHEAIRPTDVNRTPQQMQNALTSEQAKLYDLIWNRAVASLCCPVQLRKTRIITQSADVYWDAKGQVVAATGYTRYWNNLKADCQLPAVQQGQVLTLKKADAEKKQTQPPPRYTEPKLVQLMERKGIGRPSTYAPTIKTLRSRSYVQLVKGKLQPTPLGLELDAALEVMLPDLIQPDFTAQMESSLDAIAQGQQEWQSYLTGWYHTYFGPAIAQAKHQLQTGAVWQTLNTGVAPATQRLPNSTSVQWQSPTPSTSPAGNWMPQKPPTPSPFQEGNWIPQNRASETLGDRTVKPPSRRRPKPKTSNSPVPSSFQKEKGSRQNPKLSSTTAQRTSQNPKSKISCPKCQEKLHKIPSKSKKMRAKHFLKCMTPGCDTVMFWNGKKKIYELPYSQRQPDPAQFTDHPCPVCGAWLERYGYTKDGQAKEMLRCSIFENRKGKCKDVAYFQTQSGFWSPKFGNLTPH